ncbi:MAG: hypothetical protein EOO50_02340 [Flavobacterium sp.]|uniref:hypothetical protein n=1 Tax=Flavobacterium sp. TaxID=239 RepID=UPI0011F59E75|nr:hypothetical protein [Flavobacterium sp.]RZJ68279.1 MAG: hypothetical protein EOO50_02340 [Flavobacterium sp.]
MKTISYFAIALILLGTNITKAQYSTNADVAQELEGLMKTSDVDLLNVRYFYYPNLQAYFDRETSTYIYSRDGKDWIESAKLPNALRGYSVSNGKRVPIEYNGDEPYELIQEHMKEYPANYSAKRQPQTADAKQAKKDDSTLAFN